jgi:hypothetical protein
MARGHVKLEFDKAAAMRGLSEVERKHFPFAYAKSLTEVAKKAQEAVQQRTRQAFELHSEFIPRGIAIQSAKKSDFKKYGYAESAVFTKNRISSFMPIHEEGGVRNPSAHGEGRDKGVALAVPGMGLNKYNRKTRTGRTKKRWKPGTLLDAGRPHSKSRTRRTRQIGRGGRKGKPFIITGRNSGVPMIVRRVGKKRYPLEVLYIFSRKAKIKGGWQFEDTVSKVANREFETIFRRNLAEAVRIG